jgi:hypothetical protein
LSRPLRRRLKVNKRYISEVVRHNIIHNSIESIGNQQVSWTDTQNINLHDSRRTVRIEARGSSIKNGKVKREGD